jgi:glycosyltransferase involved in cell wall biosynthesis
MFSPDITFLVFAYNEERRLDLMLNLLRPHGAIVVFDNHSVDKTVEIAKRYTDEVYQHRNLGYCESEPTMDFAWSKVKTKWAYLLYVDEFIPKALMDLLKSVAAGDRYDAVEIYRRNFMYGQEIFNYGKHHLRMFVRDSVDFKGNIVHKLGTYRVAPHRILRVPKNDDTTIWHFGSYNTEKLELAHNRYANLEAHQRHEMLRQKFSGPRAIFKLLFYFVGT